MSRTKYLVFGLIIAACLTVGILGIKKIEPTPQPVLDKIEQIADSMKTTEPGDLIGKKNSRGEISWNVVISNNITGGPESKNRGGKLRVKTLFGETGDLYIWQVDTTYAIMKQSDPLFGEKAKIFLKGQLD